MTEAWASVDDVAAHLGVRKDSIYRWIEHRALPAKKLGKLWKLKLSEVDAWVRARGAGDESPGAHRRELTAGNGEEALEHVNQQRPDLILMDIMMPILGGVETLKRMRQKEELKALPVIFMSSVPRSTLDGAESMAAGFLKKPFKLQAMLAAIMKVAGTV